MPRLFIVVCLLFLSHTLLAQQKTITGRITDGKNAAIAGATITVKGTNQGTVTDDNGNYEIKRAADVRWDGCD